jgi:hypothetical protein
MRETVAGERETVAAVAGSRERPGLVAENVGQQPVKHALASKTFVPSSGATVLVE